MRKRGEKTSRVRWRTQRAWSFYILFDWYGRLCRPVLRKGSAFPGPRHPIAVSRRGCASPVEAQPQLENKISGPSRKGEALLQDRAAKPLTAAENNNGRDTLFERFAHRGGEVAYAYPAFPRWPAPASYANFNISNAGVLVPTFIDPNDRIALGTLAELFRDRALIGIHAVDLVWGLGAIHCLTREQAR